MEDKKELPGQKVQISVNTETTPILYTDNIFMSLNDDGVVFDICQKVGPANQLKIVSRIGMSKSHAQKFVKSLEGLLLSSKGKKQTGEEIIH